MAKHTEKEGSEYVLKLFVSGATSNSIKAIDNLRQILETYMTTTYNLEIIDVRQSPELAQEEQLIALPLLIKKQPLPERKLLGNMSNIQKVREGLGI